MTGNKGNHFQSDTTWVVPAAALTFESVVLLLLAGLNGLFLHELGWRWLGAVRFYAFAWYGWWVSSIRFFRISSESLTIYSLWGLHRKRVRLENVASVYGRWTEGGEVPVVYARFLNGQVILLNKGRLKLCRQLIVEIQKRLVSGENQEAISRTVLPEVLDGFQVLLIEWIWDFLYGLFLLFMHGLLLYMFLQEWNQGTGP